MKPTEFAISILVIFVLIVFISIAVVKAFSWDDGPEERSQWKEEHKDEPYDRESVIERLGK